MVQHDGDAIPHYLVEALRSLGDYAAARGSRLLVENHGGPSSDPAWMSRLLDEVGADRLGLLLDLGNFDALMLPTMALLFGGPDGAPVDPEQVFAGLDLSSLYDGIEALAPRAELVHVKAHVVGDDGTVGPVDLDRALGILTAHGYDGPLTVEYEGTGGDPWAKSARVLEVASAAVEGVAR
jgi:sugar phosphate isomerase/epimerase